MVDPSFLGIDKSHWDLINSFASWFAALGSFAAAGVALRIANRVGRARAQVTVGHRVMVVLGNKGPRPEFVMFKIVNTGDRPIRITQIGWRTGLFCKRFAIQRYEPSESSQLPVEIFHGQEAFWMIPLHAREEPWLEYFAKDMLFPHHRTALWSTRAQFFSSVGDIFEAKLEEGVTQKLKIACERLKNSNG